MPKATQPVRRRSEGLNTGIRRTWRSCVSLERHSVFPRPEVSRGWDWIVELMVFYLNDFGRQILV